MRYGDVPNIDKPVSRIVLGSIPFTMDDLDGTAALIDAYRLAGGNTIDLSHVYRSGGCHRALGEYMKTRKCRDALILFDKGCHHYGGVRRVTREAMASDIQDNHANLGVTMTDFFVPHRDDPLVPVEKIVDWANEHIRAGRIKAFGGSNFLHHRFAEGNGYATAKGLQGFSASSPNLSLASPNEPMWTECLSLDPVARDWYAESGFPVFSWSSGGGGFFAGIDTPDIRRVYHNRINFGRLERVKEFAKKLGATPTAVSLAWTLNQPVNIFALIGPTDPSQLADNLTALDISLTPDELRYLEHGC
ncbi:MAG TPA: aldo/keto reductase [Fimbriimonadaceae bacterium]|nr:aldo/keto reductase [Fimbriimonadaceae bacterium]